MGKSKSKSNSRSVSKWRKFFGSSAQKTNNDSREELGSQTTAISPSPATTSNSSVSGNSRSKSLQKRRANMTREDGNAPKTVEDHPKSIDEKKEEKKEEKKKDGGSKTEEAPTKPAKKKEAAKKEEQEASVFEEVEGQTAPAQTGTHGIKNKMRWKIDVEGADTTTKGDQKMSEVLEKLAKLRKKNKAKKCKVLKANDKVLTEEDDEKEVTEDTIINCARVLQLIKMEALIVKEISEPDQEILRAFCRSGDQEEKAEGMIEKIVTTVLNTVVQKNEYIRQVTIPGELRLFAVDEKKAKVPMMALLMARKDLLYVSWQKVNRDVENTLDGSWGVMAVKKTAQAVQSALL